MVAAISGAAVAFVAERSGLLDPVKQYMQKKHGNFKRIPGNNLLGHAEFSRALPRLTDEIFESEDDLLVFMLSAPDAHDSMHERIGAVISAITKLPSGSLLKKAKLYYTYPKVGTAAQELPQEEEVKLAGASVLARPSSTPPGVMLVLYKGQRRHKELLRDNLPDLLLSQVQNDSIQLDEKTGRLSSSLDDSLLVDWNNFFIPVYEDLPVADGPVKKVSGRNFQVRDSPILLQLFEPSCFLCFLMRPLVTSVAKELLAEGLQIEFMKMDIEANDFPPGIPVARGTPTFVQLDPKREPAGNKWQEFRPVDFVKKVSDTFDVPFAVRERIEKFPVMLTERFQLFSQSLMWQTEIDKMQEMLAAGIQTPGVLTDKSWIQKTPEAEKEHFNESIMIAMEEDSHRTDGLSENIQYLKAEIKNAEIDAILVGVELGERVRAAELVP